MESTFLPVFKNFNDRPSLGQLMKHVVAFRKYSQSISNASIAYKAQLIMRKIRIDSKNRKSNSL